MTADKTESRKIDMIKKKKRNGIAFAMKSENRILMIKRLAVDGVKVLKTIFMEIHFKKEPQFLS